MADTKISAEAAAAALDGTEITVGVQAAGMVKITTAQIKTLASASPTITGHATIEGVTATGATGTGKFVFDGTPTLVTPVLGTPTSGTLTNCTLPVGGITGLGTGVATWLATPSSANLASAVTGETGTGALVFASTPTLVTPVLGVATGTSLALGGATLGTNALAVTGTFLNTGAGVITGALTLGIASSAAGQVILQNGTNANTTTIQSGVAAASRTYTWPTNFGAAGTVLTDAAGNGTLSWGAGGGSSGITINSTTITSGTTARILYDNAGTVGELVTVPVAQGGTALASGTSGGILGYTASGVLASSVALTASAIVLGGGAGATPTPMASLGTTTTLLHGNAAGVPSFSAVNLNADCTGFLPIPVNAQTGTTYTMQTTDIAGLTTFSNGSAVAVAIPQATGSFVAANFLVENKGAGTVTFTPTTSTIDGSATLALTTGQGCLIVSDGTNYTTMRGMSTATASGNITVGTSTVIGGTTTRILYDNAGVLGEYTLSGSGTVVAMQTSPALVTPALGVATGTSLAIGGATLGGNALAVTGTVLLNSATTLGAALTYGGVTLSNAVTGTGNMVLATTPTLTTPVLGVATGTSLALGGATIGTNALAITGTSLHTGASTITGALTLGIASSAAGQIILLNGTNANTTTIQSGVAAASRVYTWPTNFGASGTVLTDAAGNGTLSWAAAGGGSIAPLNVIDANTIGQYNSTTAQKFQVYNTFTDASNYERWVVDWTADSGIVTTGMQTAGTGTIRQWRLRDYGGGIYFSHASGVGIRINAGTNFTLAGSNLLSWTDTANDAAATVDTSLARGAAGIIKFASANSFSANSTTATVLGSVGPAGANTTVQEWLTIKDAGGTTRYIPCF